MCRFVTSTLFKRKFLLKGCLGQDDLITPRISGVSLGQLRIRADGEKQSMLMNWLACEKQPFSEHVPLA